MSMKTTTPERPCLHCNTAGRCKYRDGSKHAICFRPNEVADQTCGTLKRARSGGDYLEVYPGTKKKRGRAAKEQPTPARPERPSGEDCDQFYRWLTNQPELALTSFWHDNLVRRGLTLEAVRAGLYRRMPNKGEQRRVLRRALERFPDADQIPGVSRLGSYQNGALLIPVCNIVGQIIALKLRLAEPIDGQKYAYFSGGKGPSSGSPCHVPPGTPGRADLVRIVEGELKAHISGLQTEITSISFPGCSQWSVCIPALKALGAKTVRVCFDADVRENPSVAAGLLACVQGLAKAGFATEVERWDPALGKGLDDVVLAAGHVDKLEILSPEESLAWAAECVEQTRPPSAIPSGVSDDNAKRPPLRADNPYRLAEVFLAERGERKLVCWRESFYEFRQFCYRAVSISTIENQLLFSIHNEFIREAEDKLKTAEEPDSVAVRNVTPTHVRATIAALRAITSNGEIEPPCWLNGEPTFQPESIMATKSGLVDLANMREGLSLIPPTDRLFNTVAIPHEIDMNATCPTWLAFLNSLWGDDPDSIRALAQWFGYCLTSGAELHKLLVLVGVPRSGKSTIINVLKGLIGEGNACSPMIADLDGFKLAALLDKRLACIPEIRTQNRADATKALSRLLAITGQDGQLIDRKHQSPIPDATLSIKFVFSSNVLPTFDDSSSALLSRTILLETRRSFVGQEDRTLPKRLKSELPGILLWSLRGLADLQETGDIIQPDSCLEARGEWGESNCPVRQFVSEVCELGDKCSESFSGLYRAFTDWADRSGHYATSDSSFSQKLKAAFPQLRKIRPAGGDRKRVWKGIEVRKQRGF